MISKENFTKTFDILKDRKPQYYISPYIVSLENDVEELLSYGAFKNSKYFRLVITDSIEEMIFELQKQKSMNEIPNAYLQILVNELQKSINTFDLVKVRGEEFYFQKNAKIYCQEPEKIYYYTIENVEDSFFKEVVAFSQIRYDLCVNFVNEIQELIDLEEAPLSTVQQKSVAVSAKPKHQSKNIGVTNKNKSAPLKEKTKLYTFKDLAEMFQVTQRTIYNWKDNGTLPFTQIGSKIYLTQEQLDELLEHHQVKPIYFRK